MIQCVVFLVLWGCLVFFWHWLTKCSKDYNKYMEGILLIKCHWRNGKQCLQFEFLVLREIKHSGKWTTTLAFIGYQQNSEIQHSHDFPTLETNDSVNFLLMITSQDDSRQQNWPLLVIITTGFSTNWPADHNNCPQHKRNGHPHGHLQQVTIQHNIQLFKQSNQYVCNFDSIHL